MAFAITADDSFNLFNDEQRRLLSVGTPAFGACEYDFTYGNLLPGSFPAEAWRKLTADALFSIEGTQTSCYNDNLGDFLLRLNIANHLRKSRGVRCFPEQVVIQPGTQAAIQNLLQLFNPAKDKVAMEEPGYDGVRKVFEHAGFKLIPCPTHLDTEAYLDAVNHSGARLAYVTPSHQFPIGAIMPTQSRQQLLDWARVNDAFLIEDDYCHEFRYRTRAMPSLQSLDTYHRVVYAGTFSKVLSPALRMSYLILPPTLLASWRERYDGYYSAVPWLNQAVLRRLFEEGLWDKLVRKAYTRNKRRHEALRDALQRYLGDKIDIIEGGTGLHLLIGVRDGRNQETLIGQAASAGVRVYGTDRYWIAREHPLGNHLLLGFSAIAEERIAPGIATLAQAWFPEGSGCT
ncbi:MAG: PLP-dependent aminotransferase family protein [Coriobacteriaceae bacterium]|nr:PLP-dependent aminotransferase family protein [Coriobacteriaceae bacterium]